MTRAHTDILTRLRALKGGRRLAVAFGAGALTALAQAPLYLLPLLPIGFGLLSVLVYSGRAEGGTAFAAFRLGWAFGFGYFLIGLHWLAFAFLVQADQFAWLIPFAIPLFTGFLGLFYGAATALAGLGRPSSPLNFSLRLAASFAVFEVIRGHVLTGFPWNLPAQAFAGTPLLAQTAAIWGPYGLSLVVLLLAIIPASGLLAPRLSMRPALICLAGMILLCAYGGLRLTNNQIPEDFSSPLELIVAQPSVNQRDRLDAQLRDQALLRLLAMTAAQTPDTQNSLIVWPENTYPHLGSLPIIPALLARELPEKAALFSGTVRAYQGSDGDTLYGNSGVLFGPTIGEGEQKQKPFLAIYDKHHLVPFGEYLPFKSLLNAIGLSQLAPVEDGFTPGTGPATLTVHGRRFSPLICYEDVFPRALYPEGDRPDFLVVVTNDAWFGDNAGPLQHLAISRLRTIETGLPMARAANTGMSTILNAYGEMRGSIEIYEEGVLVAPLPPSLVTTTYDRYGEVLFFSLLLVVFLASFRGAIASLV
ncbi:apolipoprotein N-acyltransferase [Parvularcula bermudensis HTCC2503]|uniref:Apolipoprotein N-acyltransferase n=1 Tax=Parvularcula bermudensis (strain ATCC BAA-594 / HTCC2503 / KCTC 12087) TaxID=314260 RepID=E0TEP4_PARBH|nr:apolipoprotein N-acyltransferase [Parvularcula bermudensis]ADM08927.1 apolipoprotein N-acyltransferase [Parvularcula bermudensis HTCC2503]